MDIRPEKSVQNADRRKRVAGQAVGLALPTKGRWACMTLDFEQDYGARIGEFNILTKHRGRVSELAAIFRDLGVPVSAFVQTDLLERYPYSLTVLQDLAGDFHVHSHTHATKNFRSDWEMAESMRVFERHFEHAPVGYRAPQGVLNDGDVDRLKTHGFKFSSSVFPSYRPGKFNHLGLPLGPFAYENEIVELPLAVVKGVRLTVSMSYLKLLGYAINRSLWGAFGLPDVLVLDSHLHDFIVSDESFAKLPPAIRAAYGINKHKGASYLSRLIGLLKNRGYRFTTMTDLYQVAAGRTTNRTNAD
jgi:peptidoglycan/xylan/chitin deacetylase (PgdA/CDA1 family)